MTDAEHAAHVRAVAAAARARDRTAERFRVVLLAAADAGVTPAELAPAVGVTRQAVSALIGRLRG